MKNLCLLVLAGVLMAGAATTGVEAASLPPASLKPPPGGGAPGGPGGATNPGGGQTYQPGQPFHPEGVCMHGLGHLPQLTVEDIAAINDGDRVKVVPVCAGFSQTTPHDMEKTSNVKGLIGWIDRNRVIRGRLTANGYRPLEVVAIVPHDDGSVSVFVHH